MKRKNHPPYCSVKDEYIKISLIGQGETLVRSSSVVGYCHCDRHKGILTKHLYKKHKCSDKQCVFFEKFIDYPYWNNIKREELKKAKRCLASARKRTQKTAADNKLVYLANEAQLFCYESGYNILITRIQKTDEENYIINYVSDDLYDDWSVYFDLVLYMGKKHRVKFWLKHVKFPNGKYVSINDWKKTNGGITLNLTPIFELKKQLRAAMISGTNLLSEDFRLKKAAEGFKAMESASPVFKKIGELTDSLLSDNCPDQPGTLLDVITLVDSVICTLGASEVTAEINDFPITETSSKIVDAPYSKLSKLIDALTKSGSGNMETVSIAWAETPELFYDYRVKPALVKGLGASYAELADYVADIVVDIGEEMLPLLKRKFNPEGKKEMVRRVTAIDKIGGGSESEFYLKQLETAKKDVRKMLIYALRHDVNNAKTLVGLCDTEKGKLKDAAIYALGKMDCEEAENYYLELEKNGVNLFSYLKEARANWAGKLTAKLIDGALIDTNDNKITLSQYQADPGIKLKRAPVVQLLIDSMLGKTGPEIEQIFRDFRLTATNTPADWQMDQCLYMSIYMTKDEGLIKLAIELNNAPETKGQYDRAEAMARLMSKEDCSEWLDKKLAEIDKKMRDTNEFNMNEPLMSVLWWLHLRNGEYVMERYYYDVLAEARPVERKIIDQPVKEKFIDILAKYHNTVFTKVINQLVDYSDKELCKKVGEYYIHEMTTVSGYDSMLLYLLENCGFTNVEGLALGWCKKNPNSDKWYIRRFLERLPGDAEYRFKEAREVIELMKAKKLDCARNGTDIEWLSDWIYTELNTEMK